MGNLPLVPVDQPSPAFDDLRKYVDKTFSDRNDGTKELIFALAYTQYSAEKKQFAKTIRKNGRPDQLATSYLPFATDNQYELFCSSAVSKLNVVATHARDEVLATISNFTVAGVSEVVAPIGKNVDRVVTLLTRRRRTVPQRVIVFVLKSAEHALHIIIAAVLLVVLARVIILAPLIGPFLEQQGLHYLGELMRLFDPGSTVSH